MKLDRAPEVGWLDRVQTLPEVLRPLSRVPRATRLPVEAAPRLSVLGPDYANEEYGLYTEAVREAIAGKAFQGRSVGDKASLLSWVRTIRLLGEECTPKGMYIDTFV